jgi:hypothetical protein
VVFVLGYIAGNYYPIIDRGDVKPIVITQKELVPQVIEQKIHVPYEVSKEIIREIQVAKPTEKPVSKPDAVVTVTDGPKPGNYNVVLDRPKEIGMMITSESMGILAGYAPNKNVSYKMFVGQRYHGGLEAGLGITWRFK